MLSFQITPLPFDRNALEPYIQANTLSFHYDKHHQNYVNKLNEALAKHPELSEQSIETLLKDLDAVPADIRNAVRNNGGGHFNHLFYWKSMKHEGSALQGPLLEKIQNTFGSMESFQELFTQSATTLFGSGWTWLVKNSQGEIQIINTANQDCPLSLGLTPLLTIDLWEHAYYLDYQNRRPDYIKDWFSLVHWEEVSRAYIV